MGESDQGQQSRQEAVEVTVKTKDGAEHTTRVHLFGLGDAKITTAKSKTHDAE